MLKTKLNLRNGVAIAICLAAMTIFASCEENPSNDVDTPQVGNVTFTPCQHTAQIRAQSNASDRVNVEFTSQGVHIMYHDFAVTCDFNTVDVTYTFVNGFLNITQQGSPNHANCICYSDVSYTITGISQSDVNVIFINGEQVYCHNENEQTQIFDGVWCGTFMDLISSTWVEFTGCITFSGNNYFGNGDRFTAPAFRSSGTYSVNGNIITFTDTEFTPADWAQYYALGGEYTYDFNADTLYIRRTNQNQAFFYKLTRQNSVSDQEGHVTFGANYHIINCISTITVFLDGINIGTLQNSSNGISECGEAGNITKTISVGEHNYRVEIRGNCTKDISGSFTVSENECKKIFIDYNQIFNSPN